jgi:hypothetical protein
MLVVRVELHSAITGKKSEIARMIIANDGSGTGGRGNYWGRAAKGRIEGDTMIPVAIMHPVRMMRHAFVTDYPRRSKHVWHLVARMLKAMDFK